MAVVAIAVGVDPSNKAGLYDSQYYGPNILKCGCRDMVLIKASGGDGNIFARETSLCRQR